MGDYEALVETIFYVMVYGLHELLVIGVASGYAWDVVETANRLGHTVVCVDNYGGADPRLDRLTTLGDHIDRALPFTVGLSSPRHRSAAYRSLAAQQFTNATALLDPSATIASTVTVGHGVYVNAGAVIGSRTGLGCAVNVNRSASIGHDNEIGWGSSIGPGAVTGGHVHIGEKSLLGVGAVVMPEVSIGRQCVIGAGAVVLRDVAPGSTVVGNPGRVVATDTLEEEASCPYCTTK